MAPLDGSGDCFSMDSPRSIEACRRQGLEDSDLEERSEESFLRHEQPQQKRYRLPKSRSSAAGQERGTEGQGIGDTTAAIQKERHEINRHRLLREVKKERSALFQGEKHKSKNVNREFTAPQRLRRFRPVANPPVSPYSPSRNAAGSSFSQGEDSSSLVSAAVDSCSLGSNHRHLGDNSANRSRRTTRLSREASGNPVLEGETQRLEALKRRRFMELKQMLAFQLRSLAREERDRLMAEKARAREATAEAKRSKVLEAAHRARIARERSGQEREKEVERQAAIKRARQQEAVRRLEAQDHLRQRQAEVAAERRAELAAQKAALLQARIDRSVRVRRAHQLRNERLAAQKADEREAAAEAARRARESETEARKAMAAQRWVLARAAAEEARRRRDEEADAIRSNAGGKMAELEGRVASFRDRQKEIAARERELREEEAAELARERHEASRRKVEQETKRRAEDVEAKFLRMKQIALAREARKEQEKEKKRAERKNKEEHRKRMAERRARAEEERREMTRRKLEEDAAKIELVWLEKERIKATRGQLSFETAVQRKNLQGHLEALKDQYRGNVRYGEIAAAVSAAATARGEIGPNTPATRRSNTITQRLSSKNTRRAAKPAFRASSPARSSSDSSRKDGAEAGNRSARPSQMESSCFLSGASTASSLSLLHGSGGVDASTRSLTRNEWATTPGKTPRKPRKAAFGGGSRRGDVADLRKRYMCDHRKVTALSTRAKKKATTTPRDRKPMTEQAIPAGIDGDGEGGTHAKHGGEEATRSTATPTAKTDREIVAVSCNADDGYDKDKTPTAAVTLLSTSTTVPNSPVPPPPPRVTSDASVLRARYDQELMAILEEEQAAEIARERALAAAKARAKAAQARATYGASTSTRIISGSDERPVSVAGEKEEAAVAAREEAQLKLELARERREASERVMRMSEEYEKALEKLTTGNKAVGSSSAEHVPAGSALSKAIS
eukprot:g11658.t1